MDSWKFMYRSLGMCYNGFIRSLTERVHINAQRGRVSSYSKRPLTSMCFQFMKVLTSPVCSIMYYVE